ncbi:efflux RND transporter periplasmic adaptor subunit [Salinimicrobium sp. GXAS 041]|uniref:efflux RND transporter periplasmic adaptor subunit n=1 Tax=Salinimicrobium sp. GXAS 041 TaxID=3400806 RepID=UPI003C74AD00
MKKVLIYIGLLAGGLLLGYWIFNDSEGAVSRAAEMTSEHDHEEKTMWTCSMHPQIMQPRPGDCPICGMELIPAAAAVDGLSAGEFTMTENAIALANIQTTTVGGGNQAGDKLNLSGQIEINEEDVAVQVAHFAGRIEDLNVNFAGEEVRRGQLLATVYSPELVAAQQELLTAARLKENQPGLYNAVRNKLKLWKLSDNQIKTIESSGEVIENFPVYANVSGTVTEKLVQEGDYVSQGQPLFRIANLGSVWAVFNAYENQVSGVEEGQEILITTNAFPNMEFEARVSFVDPVLNTSRRTVEVRTELENENAILKPGMFVRGILEGTSVAENSEEVVVVPKSAVMWTGERSLVYVKTNAETPTFEMREVRLGKPMGNSFEVVNGLSAGEEIVVNGTFTVDAAAQLQGKRSMMNQESTQAKNPVPMKMEIPAGFQEEFEAILSSYFELKDAFVRSEAGAAREKASEMLEKISNISLSGLGELEGQHVNRITKMLEAIVQNDILENQREHFRVLSENMITLVSSMDVLETNIFVMNCPMANTNKGADWLSLSREIRNPYFGEAMVTCGEIIREIK